MTDLDAGVKYALNDGWSDFAKAVPDSVDKTELRNEVTDWYARFDAIVKNALSGEPWGYSRLDAVAMIFNRLTGLDLGEEKNNYLLINNIKPAEAPVRYPFLWNASRQTKTQWPGFTDQSDFLAPLGRNIGEVIGVFADFHPSKNLLYIPFGINYWADNSVQTGNLWQLEDLITRLQPPPFPAHVDPTLAAKGAVVYADNCLPCHALPKGNGRASWATPVQNVYSDGKESILLARTADPGVLTGADPISPLSDPGLALDILTQSVVGTIAQSFVPHATMSAQLGENILSGVTNSVTTNTKALIVLKNQGIDLLSLQNFIITPTGTTSNCDSGYTPPCYESRVLRGVWAVAPYLHNGSVPTLWDLLSPASQRPPTFDVGADYDLVNVGLAKRQMGLKSTLQTTGCDDANSGNSRCGHEFGVNISDTDKSALIEFLKGL